MKRTKNGCSLELGCWIRSSSGIYEVVDLYDDRAVVAEVMFSDEGDNYTYGMKHMIVNADMSSYERV